MIEPTSNSAQRHWGIQPMRGKGASLRTQFWTPTTRNVALPSGIIRFNCIEQCPFSGQSGKHILPSSFSGFLEDDGIDAEGGRPSPSISLHQAREVTVRFHRPGLSPTIRPNARVNVA